MAHEVRKYSWVWGTATSGERLGKDSWDGWCGGVRAEDGISWGSGAVAWHPAHHSRAEEPWSPSHGCVMGFGSRGSKRPHRLLAQIPSAGWWSWDSRAAAQVDWSLMESWDCESLTGTGTSPATTPETQSSCYQQQNWQDHRFLWEAAASGEQISFRKRCVLMCRKQSFLRFSGSCEVKRKACFRLRGGKKTHHSFLPPGNPGGLAVYIWHSLSDEGRELGWDSCRMSLTHPFAVPYYPFVWGCSQPRVVQVSSTKWDVQSHPQPGILWTNGDSSTGTKFSQVIASPTSQK